MIVLLRPSDLLLARLLLLSVLLIAVILTGCDTVTSSDPDPEDPAATARLVFAHNNTVKLAELENTPPAAVSGPIRDLYSFPADWTWHRLSISPDGSHAVLTKMNTSGGQQRTFMGHMVILDLDSGSIRKSFNKADFVELMEYPVDAAMLVFGHNWMNDNEILLSIEPYPPRGDVAPLYVALVLDVTTGDVVDIQYYERRDPSPITAPTHVPHTRYDHTSDDGVITVEGTRVTGLPSPVHMYSIYFTEP